MSARATPSIAIAVSALLAGCASGPRSAGLDLDFPDPQVLAADDALYAYATNHDGWRGRINIQVSRSTDGLRWSEPGDAMPTAPGWARAAEPDIWAPEAIRVGDRYVLYFSARHATLRRPDGLTLCVGAATADSPAGPFVPQPQPLSCSPPHGVIDASPFRDGDGTLWLYLKTDGNCCDTPIQVLAARMTPDGLAFAEPPAAVLGLTNDQEWEGRVIEAPQMIRHDGRHVMIYAGNDFGARDYAVGYATCDGPAGPCRDAPENPILSRDSEGRPDGPGHPTVFAWQGRDWIAYHVWRPGIGGQPRYRAMRIAPVEWRDGRPVVGAAAVVQP